MTLKEFIKEKTGEYPITIFSYKLSGSDMYIEYLNDNHEHVTLELKNKYEGE